MARKYLKKSGLDYKHGTGHGVGYFLNVHEGPQAITRNNKIKFKEGMILSNEPGYYKNGKYGIRIENLEVVSKYKINKSNEHFLHFQNLTRVPLETKLINKKMLTKFEIDWVNKYHQKVYENLVKFIKTDNEELLNFLKRKTTKI